MTGKEKRQFDEAFLSAFHSYAELQRMLDYLDIDLNSFSNPKRSMSEAVADIRDYGERHNKIPEIIAGALEEVPGNENLQALQQQFQQGKRQKGTTTPGKHNEMHVKSDGGINLQDVQGNVNINTEGETSAKPPREEDDYETRYKQMSRTEAEKERVNREIERYENAGEQANNKKSKHPLRVFISYAHEDKTMKSDLREHMQGMVNEKLIEIWQDGEIVPGEEWDEEIKKALRQADIVLFLVSVKFMNSRYIGRVELKETLERYSQGRVTLIPIILRPCDWQSLPISKHQALPDGGSPITQWKDPDEAYLNVVQGLRRVVERLKKNTAYKNSDFLIDTQFIRPEIKEEKILPLVIGPGFSNTKYKYGLGYWQTNYQVPYYDEKKFKDRQLPGTKEKYPYLTTSDFLAEYIVQVPYELNENDYFKATTGKLEGKDYLLPLKSTFFDFFDEEFLNKELDSNKVLEIKPSGKTAVDVILRIPLKKGFMQFNRHYDLPGSANTQPDLDRNAGVILERIFSLHLLPSIGGNNPDFRALLIYENRQQLKISFNENAQHIEPARSYKREIKNHDIQNYALSNQITSIEVNPGETYSYNGYAASSVNYILPKFYKHKESPNKDYIFAVDFGTTETHIEYADLSEANPTSKPLEIGAQEKLIMSMHKDPKKMRAYPELTEYVKFFLQPQELSLANNYHFPIPSVLSLAKSAPADQRLFVPMVEAKVAFTSKINQEPLTEKSITELKWSDLQDIKNKNYVRTFIDHLLYLIRAKVLLNNGRLNQTQLYWSYPLSMSSVRKEEFDQMWRKLAQKNLELNDVDRQLQPISESVAPYYYYHATQQAISGNRPTISIDIGGKSVDVSIFSKDVPILKTSFNFGADTIFGDGYSSQPKNAMIVGYYNYFKNKLEGLGKKQLKALLDDIAASRSTKDLSLFLFDLSSHPDVPMSQTGMDFTEHLQQDARYKVVFVVYYTALLYHVAKLLKAKEIPIPAYITFSGKGAGIIQIIDPSPKYDNIQRFTQSVMEALTGNKSQNLTLVLSKDPKSVRAKGAITAALNEMPPDQSEKIVLLGDTENQLSPAENSYPFSINKKIVNYMDEELNMHEEVLEAIDKEIGKTFTTASDFLAEIERLAGKRFEKETMDVFLKIGLATIKGFTFTTTHATNLRQMLSFRERKLLRNQYLNENFNTKAEFVEKATNFLAEEKLKTIKDAFPQRTLGYTFGHAEASQLFRGKISATKLNKLEHTLREKFFPETSDLWGEIEESDILDEEELEFLKDKFKELSFSTIVLTEHIYEELYKQLDENSMVVDDMPTLREQLLGKTFQSRDALMEAIKEELKKQYASLNELITDEPQKISAEEIRRGRQVIKYKDITESFKEDVIQEAHNFIEFLVNFHKTFNLRENFQVDPKELENYKKIMQKHLKEHLKEGHQNKIREINHDYETDLGETYFFYPLIGAINDLMQEV